MSNLSMKALQIAVTQIGEEEKPRGSNWGEPVKTYLESVGLNFPASWCMAFMYWCFEKAAKELQIKNNAYKSGGVLETWRETSRLIHSQFPNIGSVFIMDLGHGLGHTGIVESFDGHYVHTIEGNTNDTGSREGFEVCRKVRPISSINKGYINY